MKDNNEFRIGFFDSGTGGLMLAMDVAIRLTALLRYLLESNNITVTFVHLGDKNHAPYGEKSLDAVLNRVRVCISMLEYLHCDIIVCACNTAVAACYKRNINLHSTARLIFSLVDDTVAYLYQKAKLVAKTDSSAISMALLSTANTMDSGIYQDKINYLHSKSLDDRDVILHHYAPSSWVANIEQGLCVDDATLEMISLDVGSLLINDHARENGTIALACTHFPFYTASIRAALGSLGYDEEVILIPQDEVMAPKIRDAILDLADVKAMPQLPEDVQLDVNVINMHSIIIGQNVDSTKTAIDAVYGSTLSDVIKYSLI